MELGKIEHLEISSSSDENEKSRENSTDSKKHGDPPKILENHSDVVMKSDSENDEKKYKPEVILPDSENGEKDEIILNSGSETEEPPFKKVRQNDEVNVFDFLDPEVKIEVVKKYQRCKSCGQIDDENIGRFDRNRFMSENEGAILTENKAVQGKLLGWVIFFNLCGQKLANTYTKPFGIRKHSEKEFFNCLKNSILTKQKKIWLCAL